MVEPLAASRTAVLVCQGRACAQGRMAPGRFDDPVSEQLLRPDELAVVERVRGDRHAPGRGASSAQLVAATARVAAARTVAVDDAIREHPTPQLVVLGAGLDGRAHRMASLAGTLVLEVDHPASQQDKRARVGDLPTTCGRLAYVAVDLRVAALEPALAAAGHDRATPTTWVWEGVVPYLDRAAVRVTLGQVASASAPGSRLVVAYQDASVVARLGRLLVRGIMRLAREADPLAGEPWRSTWSPERMGALLADTGFAVQRDQDLLDVADALGIGDATRGSLRNGRVVVADRATT